ncbi:MAG TPA: ethanolamine ammonia-lyase subunit EutC [Acetobacteraceae bacterium]|nr:ethanolamine ammonia-lyase subunit EutC [Acetobacteraceae bacterium]
MTQAPTLWQNLRRFTPARIALGRAGNAQPTEAHLAFQAAHAAARDAVHTPLDLAALTADLDAAGLPSQTVRSACPDRRTYLLRPDLGRRLNAADRATLTQTPGQIALVVCDGLSALAVQRHAAPLLAQLIAALGPAPIIIATQGRVALGDDIGAALQAEAVAVLIGERPGLSTPDSLGVYLTWQPRPGRTDAERNCISNIRPEGLSLPQAAAKLLWLIAEMRRLQLTGVALKDEQPALPAPGRPALPPSPA